jgi:predicted ATP-grasp superfamily ATP-dependent carboligase
VIFDLNKTGCAIARCLGRVGVPVTGLHTVPYPALGATSRYVTAPLVRPNASPLQQLEMLIQLADRSPEKPVLLCATDQAVDFCSRYRADLTAQFHLPDCRGIALHALLDKGRQAALAARAGLAVPPTTVVRRDEPASAARVAAIPLPAIVKPGNSLLGYKRFMGVEHTREGLDARVAATLQHCPEVVVSTYVPGDAAANQTVMGLGRRDGTLVIAAVTRKLHQLPRLAYGSGTLVETCADDEVAALAAAFVRAAGVIGPVEVECKREGGTGQPWFIEANLRFSALVEMTTATGMNLPYLAYLDALGMPLPSSAAAHPQVRWVDELRDWRLCATGELSLDELLCGYASVNLLSLFDPDDPEPFAMAVRDAREEAGAERPLLERALDQLIGMDESGMRRRSADGEP